jgi:hypothetical protein
VLPLGIKFDVDAVLVQGVDVAATASAYRARCQVMRSWSMPPAYIGRNVVDERAGTAAPRSRRYSATSLSPSPLRPPADRAAR